MWSTGFRTSGRQSSSSRIPSTTAVQSQWDTRDSWDTGIPVATIDHFTHVRPLRSATMQHRRPLSYEEKTGKQWSASNYGRATPRGWDTGQQPITIEASRNANDPHMQHHGNLHRISLQRTRTRTQNKPVLKIHRYAWNKEPLVVGGVDCSEPKTLHLSQRMSEWKRRSERQLQINKEAGRSKWQLHSSSSRRNKSFESKGIELDPGKFRRRQEARMQANHDKTLLGSFTRMQQYVPKESQLEAARSESNSKSNSISSSSSSKRRRNKKPEDAYPESTMPRSLRSSIVASENNLDGTRRRRSSGTLRRRRRSSHEGLHLKSENSMAGDGGEDVLQLPRWEELRNQLTNVIIGEGLYRLLDLRQLFDETLRNAMRCSADEALVIDERAAAQRAVAYVCNELDIPAIGRLALEHPELLVPHSKENRNRSGSRGGCGSIDSETSEGGTGLIRITHWSQADIFCLGEE